jgi:hypothetical protein
MMEEASVIVGPVKWNAHFAGSILAVKPIEFETRYLL